MSPSLPLVDVAPGDFDRDGDVDGYDLPRSGSAAMARTQGSRHGKKTMVRPRHWVFWQQQSQNRLLLVLVFVSLHDIDGDSTV